LSLIKEFEGLRLHVYSDPAGLPTIGYGHLLRPGEAFPDGISNEQAEQLLMRDVQWAEDAVNKHVSVQLSQYQFDALVSFTFNVGGNAFAGSTLLKLLNSGDYAGAADQLLRWNKAKVNGKLQELAGLSRRRQRERELFLTPEGKP
jgi:lysozyme